MKRLTEIVLFFGLTTGGLSLHAIEPSLLDRSRKFVKHTSEENTQKSLALFAESLQKLQIDLDVRLGHTPLANEIVALENNEGRKAPLKLPLDVCEVPEAYFVKPGRVLIRCTKESDHACLNIDANNFMASDIINTLSVNTVFDLQNNSSCTILVTN